jgi:hypothetical protein
MPTPNYTRTMSEFERDKVLRSEAKKYMFDNPVRTAEMFFKKLFYIHARETIAVHWNEPGLKNKVGTWVITPFKLVTQAFWIVCLLLAITGTVALFARAARERLLCKGLQVLTNYPVILWLYYAILHAIIVAQDRYHFPSIPFIAMLSAMAISILLSKIPRTIIHDSK